MSRKNQLRLAAAGLATALLLAAPAPSFAAGAWRPVAEASSLAVRFWSWLERLGSFPRPQVTVREKEGSMIDPNGAPGPEGSAIDPDGAPRPVSTSTATQPAGASDGAQ